VPRDSPEDTELSARFFVVSRPPSIELSLKSAVLCACKPRTQCTVLYCALNFCAATGGRESHWLVSVLLVFRRTPLHMACVSGRADIVAFLMGIKSIDLNARDSNNQSALFKVFGTLKCKVALNKRYILHSYIFVWIMFMRSRRTCKLLYLSTNQRSAILGKQFVCDSVNSFYPTWLNLVLSLQLGWLA